MSEDDIKRKLEAPVDLEQGGEIKSDQLTQIVPGNVRVAEGLDGRLYLFYLEGQYDDGSPKWRGFGVDPGFATAVAAEVAGLAMSMVMRDGSGKLSH